jgi:hypothetical protein
MIPPFEIELVGLLVTGMAFGDSFSLSLEELDFQFLGNFPCGPEIHDPNVEPTMRWIGNSFFARRGAHSL